MAYRNNLLHPANQSNLTFDPNIRRGSNGEYEQKQNKQERLQVIGRHLLHTEHNRPQQLSLRRVKSRPQHIRHTPIIRRPHPTHVRLGRRRMLHNNRASRQHMQLAIRLNVEAVRVVTARLDRLLDHGHRLARQHRLVENTLAAQQEHVTRQREGLAASAQQAVVLALRCLAEVAADRAEIAGK